MPTVSKEWERTAYGNLDRLLTWPFKLAMLIKFMIKFMVFPSQGLPWLIFFCPNWLLESVPSLSPVADLQVCGRSAGSKPVITAAALLGMAQTEEQSCPQCPQESFSQLLVA